MVVEARASSARAARSLLTQVNPRASCGEYKPQGPIAPIGGESSWQANTVTPARPALSSWFPRGADLLHDPELNKGTAFTEAERDVLGLKGLLPPHVHSQGEQVARVLGNLRRLESPLEKYIFMSVAARSQRGALLPHRHREP